MSGRGELEPREAMWARTLRAMVVGTRKGVV